MIRFSTLTLALSLSTAATGHESVNGWTYPTGCCSQVDCRVVSPDRIAVPNQTRQSYTIKNTGEEIPLGDTKLRPSPDSDFHWCSVGGIETGATRCLFVPQGGV